MSDQHNSSSIASRLSRSRSRAPASNDVPQPSSADGVSVHPSISAYSKFIGHGPFVRSPSTAVPGRPLPVVAAFPGTPAALRRVSLSRSRASSLPTIESPLVLARSFSDTVAADTPSSVHTARSLLSTFSTTPVDSIPTLHVEHGYHQQPLPAAIVDGADSSAGTLEPSSSGDDYATGPPVSSTVSSESLGPAPSASRLLSGSPPTGGHPGPSGSPPGVVASAPFVDLPELTVAFPWQGPLPSDVHRDILKACTSSSSLSKLPSDPVKYRSWRDDLHALLSMVHFLDREFWILAHDEFHYVCSTLHPSYNRMLYDIIALRLTSDNSSYLKNVALGDGLQVYVNIATDMIGNSSQTYRLYNCLKDIIGLKGGVAANSIAEFNTAEASLLASLEEFQLTTGVLLPDTVAATLLCNKLHPQFDAAIYPLLVSNAAPLTLRALRGVVAASLHFKSAGARHARPPLQNMPRSSSNILSASSQASSKGGLTCHRCGKQGHTTKECDKPDTVNCRHCLRTGHLTEACMKKKQGLPASTEAPSRSALKGAHSLTVVPFVQRTSCPSTAIKEVHSITLADSTLDPLKWGDEAVMDICSMTVVPGSWFPNATLRERSVTTPVTDLESGFPWSVRPTTHYNYFTEGFYEPAPVELSRKRHFVPPPRHNYFDPLSSVLATSVTELVHVTVDTGAEVHCTGDPRFKPYCREVTTVALSTATGEIARSCGAGTVMLFTECGHGIILKDLQYVEGLKKTLIAPKLLLQQGIFLNCIRNRYELLFADEASVRLNSFFSLDLFLPRSPDVCPAAMILTPRKFAVGSRIKVHYTYFKGESAPFDDYFHGHVTDLRDAIGDGGYRYKIRFDDTVVRTVREIDLLESTQPVVPTRRSVTKKSSKAAPPAKSMVSKRVRFSDTNLPDEVLSSDGTRYYCKPCDTYVPVKAKLSHDEGSPHQAKLLEIENSKRPAVVPDPSMFTSHPVPVPAAPVPVPAVPVQMPADDAPCYFPAPKISQIDKLHLQFNHANEEVLKHLGQWSDRYKLPPGSTLSPCDVCLRTKATMKYAGKTLTKTLDCLQVFDLVHSDSGGRIEPTSLQGHSFYHLFVDSFSGYMWYNGFATAPTSNHLQTGLQMLRTDIGYYPRALHSDNGSDYTAASTSVFCNERNIKQTFATPYHHDQNGTAERAQRTIWTAARTALTAANAPDNLWEYALLYSIMIKNMTPMRRLGWLSPYELVFGVRPLERLAAFHPFGCVVYFHLHEKDPSHLVPRATKGVFLGVAANSAAHTYIVGHYYYDGYRDGLQIIRTSDVVFLDHENFFDAPDSIPEKVTDQVEESVDDIRFANAIDTYADPRSSKEAANRPPLEAAEWKRGEDKEWLENVLVNACEIVDMREAEGHKIIPTHCVYKLKPAVLSLNKPQQYKVRVVVRGNLEDPSNIGSVFAPTIPIMVFRMVIAIFQSSRFQRNRSDLVLRAGDVSNAFCLAPMPADKVVFIYPPLPRYRIPGKIFRLKSALYGLAESPRLWYEVFNKLLQKFGFLQSEHEPCLFYTQSDGQLSNILIIFVDDCLFAGSLDVWNAVVAHLQASIPFKDLGRPDKFLGLNLSYSPAGIWISHHDYVDKVLDKFDFAALNPSRTPMDANVTLARLPERVVDPSKYQQLVGSLIHTSSYYNLAICFALKELSRHLLAHNKTHFDAVKRVYRYLKGSRSLGLFAAADGDFRITTYVDANWAPKSSDRRSTSGLVQLFDTLPVAFSSKEQKSIALSTCEAELFAISQAVRLIGYQRALLLELQMIPLDYCFTICTDSRSAMDLIANNAAQIPAKHIDIRLKYIREQVDRGRIKLIHVPSADNLADICTKPLPIDAFTAICSRLFRSQPSMEGGVNLY